jgi:putative acetyltransferase
VTPRTGQIRQMQDADLSRVEDIWLRVSIVDYAFVRDDRHNTPEEFWRSRLPEMKQAMREADGYVYEAGGQVEGFITLRPSDGYIYELFVDFPFQGQHIIGPAFIKLAKSLVPYIYADVYLNRVKAVRFYERQGFLTKEVREEKATDQLKLTMEWKAE